MGFPPESSWPQRHRQTLGALVVLVLVMTGGLSALAYGASQYQKGVDAASNWATGPASSPTPAMSTPAAAATYNSLNGTVSFTLSNQVLNLTQVLAVTNPITNAISTQLSPQNNSGSWILQVQLVNDSLTLPPSVGYNNVPVYFKNATAVVLFTDPGQAQFYASASITGDFSVGPLQMHELSLQWQTKTA